MFEKPLIDAKELSLEEWLNFVTIPSNEREVEIEDSHFVTDKHLKEYLETIHKRDEKEVRIILDNLLLPCCSLGIDKITKAWLSNLDANELENTKQRHTYFKRILDPYKPNAWEGIKWVLDLLPHHPQEAIYVLDSYFIAHCQLLPDGRLHALSDATAIIKKRYFEHDLPVKTTLLDLTPRNFELLTGYLYKKKGYEVTITPRSSDGGYDVLAEKRDIRTNERLHIECKRYEQNIGVQIVRAALGTLVVKNATKAVIITSSDFTRPAILEAKESKRIELVNSSELDKDMRKFVNVNWTDYINRYVMEMQKKL